MTSERARFRGSLQRAQQGDRAAMSRLLGFQHAYLSTYVQRRHHREQQPYVAVEDVLQETYLAAFRGIERYVGDSPEAFRAWLIGIAENKLRETRKAHLAKKRGGHHRRLEIDRTTVYGQLVERIAHVDATPSRCVALKEGEHQLALALAAAKSDDRQAIELRYFKSMSFDDMGKQMGISSEAAKKRCSRAIQRLKAFMSEDPRLSSR